MQALCSVSTARREVTETAEASHELPKGSLPLLIALRQCVIASNHSALN